MQKALLILSLFFIFTQDTLAQSAGTPVTWTDLVGVTVLPDNTMKKTAPYGTDNGGAASQEVLPASNNGWVETTVLETGKMRYFGLSDTNTDATLGTMDFAIELSNATPNVFVYENGTKIGWYGQYTTGEVYRIERVGTTIYYKRDGVTFYTSTAASTTDLVADVTIYHTDVTVNAQISFGSNDPPSASPVTWTDLVGVNVETDNTLTKTAPYGTDNGGAASQEVLPASTDGWAETTVLETGTTRYFGLSDTNTDATLGTMDYAIELTNYTPKIFVYENGTRISYFGEYAVGEVYRIERVGTTIYYKRDGTTFYTSTVPSTTSLLVDVSIHVVGGTIHNAQVSFGADEPPPVSENPIQTLAIDFSNSTDNTPANWNRISNFAVGGTIGNLLNLQQQNSGYTMEVTDDFNGAWVSGLSTGNDSGPVPDAVMATFWYNQYNQGILKFIMDNTKKYTFRFYGGRDGSNDDKSSDYTIGDTTVTLYNRNNISNTVEIDNVVPNANGEVFVSIKGTEGYVYAILNGIIIEEYSNGNNAPILVTVPDQNLSEGGVVDIPLSVTNANDGSLVFSGVNLPGFATVTDQGNGTAMLSLRPKSWDIGEYQEVIVKVTDQGNMVDADTLSITVANLSGQVPLQVIGVNFKDNVNLYSPGWNPISDYQTTGAIADLQNLQGAPTGYSLQVVQAFNGAWHKPFSTGDDSGAMPDAVIESFWYTRYTYSEFKVTLDPAKKYRFKVFGGKTSPADDISGDYIIGNDTITLYNRDNKHNEAVFDHVVPNANGEVYVRAVNTEGYEYAILNGLVIEEYIVETEEPVTYVPLADNVQNRPNDETGP